MSELPQMLPEKLVQIYKGQTRGDVRVFTMDRHGWDWKVTGDDCLVEVHDSQRWW